MVEILGGKNRLGLNGKGEGAIYYIDMFGFIRIQEIDWECEVYRDIIKYGRKICLPEKIQDNKISFENHDNKYSRLQTVFFLW